MIKTGQAKFALALLATILALAGCGSATTEIQKVRTTGIGVGKAVSRLSLHLPCHPSFAQSKRRLELLDKKTHYSPTATQIKRALCP